MPDFPKLCPDLPGKTLLLGKTYDAFSQRNNLNGTSKKFQFLGRPFLAVLVGWAKRPEPRVRGSDWLSA